MSEPNHIKGGSGVYVAIFHLGRPGQITVGRLGRFSFPAGFYFYVGSARRCLDARLARHARRRKPLRWHIDYLSSRAEMLGAVVADAGSYAECELAQELAELYPRCVRGFGSSDCRCGGHLFHSQTLTVMHEKWRRAR